MMQAEAILVRKVKNYLVSVRARVNVNYKFQGGFKALDLSQCIKGSRYICRKAIASKDNIKNKSHKKQTISNTWVLSPTKALQPQQFILQQTASFSDVLTKASDSYKEQLPFCYHYNVVIFSVLKFITERLSV